MSALFIARWVTPPSRHLPNMKPFLISGGGGTPKKQKKVTLHGSSVMIIEELEFTLKSLRHRDRRGSSGSMCFALISLLYPERILKSS